jgi:hypothetical protein
MSEIGRRRWLRACDNRPNVDGPKRPLLGVNRRS